jgi:hypothetical protein
MWVYSCALRLTSPISRALLAINSELRMTSREIIKALKADGWNQVAKVGSHVQLKYPT